MPKLEKIHIARRDVKMNKLIRKYCVVDAHGMTLLEFFNEAEALLHVKWDLDQTISFKMVRDTK